MYRIEHDAFGDDYREIVERALLGSRYVGKSPLGEEFVETQGFSIAFQRSALSEVLVEFPYLRAFLETALFSTSNALYVNPLIMRRGSRVGAHVDCRLVVDQNVRIIPNIVSIYYVSVAPEAVGGDLTLNIGTATEVIIRPQQGDLLHFPGDVIHEVSPITSDHTRIGVVCEQYNLPDSMLEWFPTFDIVLDEAFAPRVATAIPVGVKHDLPS
jgi:hypothetical protein